MIYLTFRVLFVKLCSLMLCLDSSVPEDVPRCSASTLALLASFINSDVALAYLPTTTVTSAVMDMIKSLVTFTKIRN